MNRHIEKTTMWLANIPGAARRILSFFYLALIALMSLLPSHTFEKVPFLFENEDKVIHFLMYGGMAVMLCWTFPRRNRKWLIYYAAIVLICTGFGMLMEILQGTFPQLGRSFSWADEAANITGTIFFIPIKELLLTGKIDRLEQR